jgi:hypothetical protein
VAELETSARVAVAAQELELLETQHRPLLKRRTEGLVRLILVVQAIAAEMEGTGQALTRYQQILIT